MKARFIQILAFALLLGSTNLLAEACEIADPDKLINPSGDTEFTLDPQATDGSGLVVNCGKEDPHTHQGNLYIARINGISGVIDSPRTYVSYDCMVSSNVQGGEWAFLPTKSLGVLYQGPKGVQGAFRAPPSPGKKFIWNEFKHDSKGVKIPDGQVPPPLEGTFPGMAPQGSPPFGISSYGGWSWWWNPVKFWFGPAVSEPNRPMIDTAFLTAPSGEKLIVTASTLSPVDDKTFFIQANKEGTTDWGIYQVIPDAQGVGIPIKRKTMENGSISNADMVSAILPGTVNKIILFTLTYPYEGATTGKIEIWKQQQDGTLSLITSYPVTQANHLRAITNKTQIVLQYQGWLNRRHDEINGGTWGLSLNQDLTSTPPRRITSQNKGTEWMYLPLANIPGVAGAGRWATYLRDSNHQLNRCWITQPGQPF